MRRFIVTAAVGALVGALSVMSLPSAEAQTVKSKISRQVKASTVRDLTVAGDPCAGGEVAKPAKPVRPKAPHHGFKKPKKSTQVAEVSDDEDQGFEETQTAVDEPIEEEEEVVAAPVKPKKPAAKPKKPAVVEVVEEEEVEEEAVAADEEVQYAEEEPAEEPVSKGKKQKDPLGQLAGAVGKGRDKLGHLTNALEALQQFAK